MYKTPRPVNWIPINSLPPHNRNLERQPIFCARQSRAAAILPYSFVCTRHILSRQEPDSFPHQCRSWSWRPTLRRVTLLAVEREVTRSTRRRRTQTPQSRRNPSMISQSTRQTQVRPDPTRDTLAFVRLPHPTSANLQFRHRHPPTRRLVFGSVSPGTIQSSSAHRHRV